MLPACGESIKRVERTDKMADQVEQLLKMSIESLRRRYLVDATPVPVGLIDALAIDSRLSARHLAARLQARRTLNLAEGRRLRDLLKFEHQLSADGMVLIAGVDEAGVGPMAGPVVAGAVILPANYRLPELDDSKKLTATKRDLLATAIKNDAISWSIGIAEVEEIDHLNVYHASLLAMRRAVNALAVKPDHLLVDARTIPNCDIPQLALIHGDALSASIAAASIIAKTTRDKIMIELDLQYPGYGLAIHKGYATATHLRAIQDHGVLSIHRRSFRPVREALGLEPRQSDLFS